MSGKHSGQSQSAYYRILRAENKSVRTAQRLQAEPSSIAVETKSLDVLFANDTVNPSSENENDDTCFNEVMNEPAETENDCNFEPKDFFISDNDETDNTSEDNGDSASEDDLNDESENGEVRSEREPTIYEIIRDNNLALITRVAIIAIYFKLPNKITNIILALLIALGYELPKDSRTIKKNF